MQNNTVWGSGGVLVLIVCVLLCIALAVLGTRLYGLKKDAEQERSKCEQILLAFSDAILIINPQGRVEMLNSLAEKLTGWTRQEAVGRAYGEIYNTRGADSDLIAEALEGRSRSRSQVFLMSKGGQEFAISDRVSPLLHDYGQLLGVICTFKAMTRRQTQQARLAQLTFRDSLTGLYNRAFFEQELPRLDQPARWPLSVLVGDLNGLKLTNDVFGHSVGDELLIAVSHAFLEVCRPEDRVFRWGGDEFIVLLPKTGQDEANAIRQRLQGALEGRAVGPITVNLPLGCSTKEHAGQDIRAVWQQAEEEMYWLKTVEHTRFQKETLHGIVKELHGRSVAEKEHAERVSSLAEELGRYLGLANHELRKLRLCGLLHDIGKVALDAEVLRQPYPLKPEDENEMKRHPLVGFRLLNSFEDTADLADAVLAHHERWDGRGYPKGLKEDEIPYFGRILAVVETYDRVHSIRPERALELIQEGSGSRFDPAISNAFLEMMGKKSA